MTKNSSECINRVGCNVQSCAHNTEGCYCIAEKIDVANEKAERKAETFCATFAPKGTVPNGTMH